VFHIPVDTLSVTSETWPVR